MPLWIPYLILISAGLGGLALATWRFSGRSYPLPVSLTHGLIGLTGAALLLAHIASWNVGIRVVVAFGLHLFAALLGIVIVTLRVRTGRPAPQRLVAVHVAFNSVALVVLTIEMLWPAPTEA